MCVSNICQCNEIISGSCVVSLLHDCLQLSINTSSLNKMLQNVKGEMSLHISKMFLMLEAKRRTFFFFPVH